MRPRFLGNNYRAVVGRGRDILGVWGEVRAVGDCWASAVLLVVENFKLPDGDYAFMIYAEYEKDE